MDIAPDTNRGTKTGVVRSVDDAPIREQEETMSMNKKVITGVYILLILLGVGTGYVLAKQSGSIGSPLSSTPKVVNTDTVVGSTDEKTFKDSAEGVIEAGGSNGEGSHKLIREGGPSQTAYLVSSVVDLDSFAGKKVRVWGATMAAKKVSWLMDVGKVELLGQ